MIATPELISIIVAETGKYTIDQLGVVVRVGVGVGEGLGVGIRVVVGVGEGIEV